MALDPASPSSAPRPAPPRPAPPRPRGPAPGGALRRAALGLFALLAASAPSVAHAVSALRVPTPARFGAVEAATYDESGDRVGPATFRVDRLPDGAVRVSAVTGIEAGARTEVRAELEPVAGTDELRPVRQESRSYDAAGAPLGVMEIDHARGVASCTPSGGTPQTLALREGERVANVLLNLIFEPLARGEVEQVPFQVFVCRGGPRVIDGRAEAVPVRVPGPEPRELVEVRFGLELGPVLTRLVAPFLPRLSAWFEPEREGGWVAQRLPLFARGPTVLIVRSGVPARWLLGEN